MAQSRTLTRWTLCLVLLALSVSTSAQETCGVTIVVHRNGFEAGALPGYVPPADSTPLALSVTFPLGSL